MTTKSITISILALLTINVFLVARYFSYDARHITGQLIDKFDGLGSAQTVQEVGNIVWTSPNEAISPTISGNSVIYYEKGSGKVSKANLTTGKIDNISENVLNNFLSSIWAPDAKQVVSIFHGSLGNEFRYYDYPTKRSVLLEDNIRDVVFAPDSDKIAYFKSIPEGGEIYISNPDGTNPYRVNRTSFLDADLDWLDDNLIAMSAINQADKLWYVFSINREGEMRKIFDGLMNLKIAWSKDGRVAIYSHTEDGILKTVILNIVSGREIRMSKEVDASQCVWFVDKFTCLSNSGNEVIYLGMDGNISEGAKISKSLNASEIMTNTDESHLLILNRADNRLYSIRLN